MKKTLTIAAIAMVAVVTAMRTTASADAVDAKGIVVSINKAEKHGTIERTDDGSNNLYQFRIPADLVTGPIHVDVGHIVSFTIDPENSRHATNVVPGPCPPDCTGWTLTHC